MTKPAEPDKGVPDLDIATGRSRDSVTWRNSRITWGELVGWAHNPADTKECGGVIYGSLIQDKGPRERSNIATRSALSLDADHAEPSFLSNLRGTLHGTAYLAHTTYSSTPEAPRWRVIVPLAEPVDPETYTALSAAVLRALDSTRTDPGEWDWAASTRPESFMWRPAGPDGKVDVRVGSGAPLDPADWAVEVEEEAANFAAEAEAIAARAKADRDPTPGEVQAALSVLQKQLNRVADAIPGERNETVASALWTVAMLGKAGCFDLEEAVEAVREVAPFGNGYTPAEFQASLAGALEKAPAEFPIPREEWRDGASAADDFEPLEAEAEPDLPDPLKPKKKEVLAEVRRQNTFRLARIMVREIEAAEERAGWVAPTPLSLDAARDLPPTEFRVQGLVPGNGHTSLVAQAKTGKTTLIGNYARSLLTGEDFLGEFAVRPLEGSVALLNYEMDPRTLADWYLGMRVPSDRFHLLNLRGHANPLSTEAGREWLSGWLQSVEAEAVILDPFGRAYNGESQNDAQEVRAWLVALDDLVRGAGGQDVVVAVHMGWENSRVRGSTALKDHPDSLVTLTREDTGTRFLEAVGRDVDVPRGELVMDHETRLLRYTPPEVTAAARAMAAANEEADVEEILLGLVERTPGIGTRDLTEAVPGRRAKVQEALDTLISGRRIEKRREGRGFAHYLVEDDLSDFDVWDEDDEDLL